MLKRPIEGPRALGMRIAPDLSVRLLGGCSVMALARPADGAAPAERAAS